MITMLLITVIIPWIIRWIRGKRGKRSPRSKDEGFTCLQFVMEV